jgi:hypothetical protein
MTGIYKQLQTLGYKVTGDELVFMQRSTGIISIKENSEKWRVALTRMCGNDNVNINANEDGGVTKTDWIMVTTEILDLVIAEKGLNVPAPAVATPIVEAPIETEKKKK